MVFVLGPLATLLIWLVWQNTHLSKVETWPATEGTIQSVSAVVVHAGRGSFTVEVANFSYTVNDEYYSGRLTISPSFSTGDRSPKVLVNQRIKVRYDPRKPEKFSVSQSEVEGFLLGSYNESFTDDIDPIALNLDKS
jgi:hypothetical protein